MSDTGELLPDATSSSSLASLRVENLHGKFTYEVNFGSLEGPAPEADGLITAVNDERLSLLYGRNGSGKTSLLTLLFHGLSADDQRGHRRAMARVKFDRFDVKFVNGDAVTYRRDHPTVRAPLVLEVSADGQEVESIYTGEPERFEDETPAAVELLATLAINPTLLSDSRAFHSDLLEKPDAADERLVVNTRRRLVEDLITQRRNADLAYALDRVQRFISQLVLAGARRGSQRVDSVYVDVASVIVEHAQTVGRPRKSTVPDLRARIEAIAQRAGPYSSTGLIPRFPQDQLLSALAGAQARNGPLLDHVLSPYLDGVEQRMSAFEPGLKAISTYVSSVNSFLEGKQLTFSPGLGSTISDEATGEELEPHDLSSGEKQILLLLANLIAMRDSTKLFIIDEPELSLNPGWQRNLMPALLSVTEGTAMQIVAATHSIEIMARYQSRLRPLAE